MNKKELFLKFSESEVYLEPNLHVYVHKETGEIFNSVTTALHLFEEEFEQDGTIDGIIKQYNTLKKWFLKKEGNPSKLVDFVKLYSQYSKLRPSTIKYYNQKPRHQYKELSKYETVGELVNELTELKLKNLDVPKKGCYINEDGSIMDKETIVQMWEDMNELSRHYGHIIHESIEYGILSDQAICFDDDAKMSKFLGIKSKAKELSEKLSSINKPTNKELFDEYILRYDILEYIDYIYLKFKKINPSLGLICVPEKVMYSKKYKLTGTADLDNIYDNRKFKIGDHKTNKQFNFTSLYHKKLYYPFDDMDDCEYNKYSLQLNTYGYIQESEYDREFLGSWVTFFDRSKQEFKHIDIPHRMDLAKKLLEHQYEYFNTELEKYLASGIFDSVNPNYHRWLTKVLTEDIKERKKKNTLFESKQENRKFYKNFINEKIKKLESTLKNRVGH